MRFFCGGGRLDRLDRAATLDRGCWGEAFDFLEHTAERIIRKGLLFDDLLSEVEMLRDPGVTYEERA